MLWVRLWHWALPFCVRYTRHPGNGWNTSYSHIEIGLLCVWYENEWIWKEEKQGYAPRKSH